MALYRIIETLATDGGRKYPAGSVNTLKKFSADTVAALLKLQRISEVRSPPLFIFPGWGERAELLATIGITDVNQLLTADLKVVAKKLNVSVSGLQRAAKEARGWIEHRR